MPVTSSVIFKNESLTVYVNRRVYESWLLSRQLRPEDNEQFGILIGSQSEDQSEFWLEYATKPQMKDVSTRISFKIKDDYHQEFINRKFIESNSELSYIGTWHTHPSRNVIPSSIDKNDWVSCINRNTDRQLFFSIVANEQIKLFYYQAGSLISLISENHE